MSPDAFALVSLELLRRKENRKERRKEIKDRRKERKNERKRGWKEKGSKMDGWME